MESAFQERIRPEGVARAYASVEEAFDRGDYHFVVRNGKGHPEYWGAAFILIGNPRRGLSIFREHAIHTAFSRLVSAFAHWYLGDREEARAQLAGILADHPDDGVARRFYDLLDKPRLNVLIGSSRPSVIQAFRQAKEFDVKVVGFPGQNVDYALDDLGGLGGSAGGREALQQADLFFLYDQGVPVPRDLADVPVPCVAFIPDAEMHLANQLEEMRLFDAVITTCSHIRLEMEALYGGRIYASPIIASLSSLHETESQTGLPPEMARYQPDMQSRPIDILFTGSVNTPMYLEKPPAVFNLARIDGKADIRIFDRAFPFQHYKQLMRGAKFTVVSVRMLDPLSTRALQALREGTMVLHPQPCALDLYLEPEKDGVFPIDPAAPEADVYRVLADYPRLHADFVLRHADLMRRMDDLFPASPEIETRWLKLALFLSLWTPRRAKSARPLNCAVNWWTKRHFAKPEAVLNLLIQDVSQPDAALKLLVSRAAMAATARDCAELRALGQSSPPMANDVPTALPWRLTQAFCLLMSGDEGAGYSHLEAIWAERASFVASPWDGLVWFDFVLGVWLRHYFLSEAHFTNAAIAQAVAEHGGAEWLSETHPPPKDVLLSGVAASLAYRAVARGNHGRARELADEALVLHPGNYVAKHVGALVGVISGSLPESARALEAGAEAISFWPWYLPELLPFLRRRPELDALLFDGRAEVHYLKFFQRVRTDRQFVSSLHLPRSARGYVRDKLGIRAEAGMEAPAVLECLRQNGLDLSPVESLACNVILPLLWDAAEERWRHDRVEALALFDSLASTFGSMVEPLQAEFDPWRSVEGMAPPDPCLLSLPLPSLL
ncbi:MAG: hypothetical protein ACM3Q1_04245 [Bacteroidales bacterium]